MPTDTQRVAWRVEQGERETLTFPVLDVDGDVFPIDGWNVAAIIRTRPGGALLYTWPAELATIDSDENTLQLVIPAAVSTLWEWTQGWYTVVITNPNSVVDDPSTYRILEGPFIVNPA